MGRGSLLCFGKRGREGGWFVEMRGFQIVENYPLSFFLDICGCVFFFLAREVVGDLGMI